MIYYPPSGNFRLANSDSSIVAVGTKVGLPYVLQRVMALICLITLSPLMLAVVFAIRLESRGPAFFYQTRVGVRGQRFRFYKFRSMRIKSDPAYREPKASESDREGICQKFYSDPRITRLGRFIRKFSIDELPQLINVLLGDMALIGPRPALTQEVDRYDYRMLRRLDCQPGITGLWQISGRANTTFEEQVTLDIKYARERSLGLDLYILLATLPAVILAKGAY